MRLFIAIDIPHQLKETIARAIEPLKCVGLNATWVAPENIHITLKFLGETRDEQIADIKARMCKVCSRHAALNAQLTGFDFFPNSHRPRVFYIGTDNEMSLRKVAYEIEENFEELGFNKENRFRAHLTLARFKSAKNIERIERILGNIHVTGNIPIAALTLFKSTRATAGPVYEMLFTAPLKAN